MTLSRTPAAAAALMLTVAMPALGQQAAPATPAPTMPGASTQAGEMSDAMVQKVGTALKHVMAIRQQYAQQAQSVDTPKRQDLRTKAERDMVKAIDDQGLSLDQYDQAIQMAQSDQRLRDRLVKAAQSAD